MTAVSNAVLYCFVLKVRAAVSTPIHALKVLTVSVKYLQGGSKHGSPLLPFLMRTAMHGKSRLSSAISVCDN